MKHEQFWRLSYDAGLTDLDPKEWEISYVDAIKETFEKFPQQLAFTFMGMKVKLAELDRYANRFANMLIAHGFKKGDVVGINLPNIPEYIIAWLGTLKAGCVASGLSPLLSTEEMEHQLKDSDARGLVTLDAIFAGRLVHIASRLHELKLVVAANVGGFMPRIKRILGKLLKKIPQGKVTELAGKYVLHFKEAISPKRYPNDPPEVKVIPDDIAYIQYTGGTTGMPKGAMISHRNSVADLLIAQKWLGWEKGQGVALSGFPFFHIAGTFFAANAIYLGWPQILIPNPRDTNHICKEIRKHKPTHLVNVPSLYQMLICQSALQDSRSFPASGLHLFRGAFPGRIAGNFGKHCRQRKIARSLRHDRNLTDHHDESIQGATKTGDYRTADTQYGHYPGGPDNR